MAGLSSIWLHYTAQRVQPVMERMMGSMCLYTRHAIEPRLRRLQLGGKCQQGPLPHRSGLQNHPPSNATARSSPACPSRYAAASLTDFPSDPRLRSEHRRSGRIAELLGGLGAVVSFRGQTASPDPFEPAGCISVIRAICSSAHGRWFRTKAGARKSGSCSKRGMRRPRPLLRNLGRKQAEFVFCGVIIDRGGAEK
jgi:hypothetical protein